MKLDIIGDVHGHTRALCSLLDKLGYRRTSGGVYSHPDPDRRAAFVGDLIDRGPEIPLTVRIVRGMVERGSAVLVMGNHEYNAVCFATPSPRRPHAWLRSRTDKHLRQHIETLYQFRDCWEQWTDHLQWFAALPLYLDLGSVRIVHASWDPHAINVVRRYSPGGNRLTPELLERGTVRDTPEFAALQNLLKGVELDLPSSGTFVDKDGNVRREMRVRWWAQARGRSYRDLVFPESETVGTAAVTESDVRMVPGYDESTPVFFGHYWQTGDVPKILTPHVACMDYSVAKGGYLAAYAWSGESELTDEHFVTIREERNGNWR